MESPGLGSVDAVALNQQPSLMSFSDIFHKQMGIFSPNFTRPLYVPIYARLSPTMTKLCHIKCDHPACNFRRRWTNSVSGSFLMSTKNKKLQSTVQLFHPHGSMGHGQ